MDDDEEINRLLAELGLELPNVEENAGDDELPPHRDDWEDFA